ncbi:hypothetical protein GGF50DRAFT_122587 [Schizophyllum commune]
MQRSATPSRPSMRWKDRVRPKLRERYAEKHELLRAELEKAYDALQPSERVLRKPQMLREFEGKTQRLKEQEEAEWMKMVEDRVNWRVMAAESQDRATSIERKLRNGLQLAPLAKRTLELEEAGVLADDDQALPPPRRTRLVREQPRSRTRQKSEPAQQSRNQPVPSPPIALQRESPSRGQARSRVPASVPAHPPNGPRVKAPMPTTHRARSAEGEQGSSRRQPTDTLFRSSSDSSAAPPLPPKDFPSLSLPHNTLTQDPSHRSPATRLPQAETDASGSHLRRPRARRTAPITSEGAHARPGSPPHSNVASGASPYHEPRVVDGVSGSAIPLRSGARGTRGDEAERDRLERVLANLADEEEYHLPNTKRRIQTELDDEFDMKGQVWRLKGKFLLGLYEARRARDDVIDCERGYRPRKNMRTARAALKKATDEEEQLRHDFVEVLDRWEEARKRVISRLRL